MDKDVVRFNISMHNIAARQYFECLNHLPKEKKASFFRERSFFLHQLVHCSTVAVLVDKVKVIGSFKHVNILYNIWTILQVGEDVDLVDSAFL